MKTITKKRGKVTVRTWWDEVNCKLYRYVAICKTYTLRFYIFESPILQADENQAKANLRQVHKEDMGIDFARFAGSACR